MSDGAAALWGMAAILVVPWAMIMTGVTLGNRLRRRRPRKRAPVPLEGGSYRTKPQPIQRER